MDTESDEDLEPWDQAEAGVPLRLQDAILNPIGSASEVTGEREPTPENALRPPEGSAVCAGEGNAVFVTGDLRVRRTEAMIPQVANGVQPGARQESGIDTLVGPPLTVTSAHSVQGSPNTFLPPLIHSPRPETSSSSSGSPLSQVTSSGTGEDSFSPGSPRTAGAEQTGILPAQGRNRPKGFNRPGLRQPPSRIQKSYIVHCGFPRTIELLGP